MSKQKRWALDKHMFNANNKTVGTFFSVVWEQIFAFKAIWKFLILSQLINFNLPPPPPPEIVGKLG